MTKKTIPLNFSWLLFFLTTIYTFLVGQLYYLTTKGPDYAFYEPYFNYFFGKLPSTGVEQGLLYYFLNASIIIIFPPGFKILLISFNNTSTSEMFRKTNVIEQTSNRFD